MLRGTTSNPQTHALPLLCSHCTARAHGICGALEPEQLKELSSHARRQSLPAGKELLIQGEATKTYSNVLQGVVKLTKMLSDGRQQIVGLKFAPAMVGRSATGESTVSAETATDTQTCSFPRDLMDKLTTKFPALEHRLHGQVLRELDDARDWMLTLGRKTAQEKLASFLIMLARHNRRSSTEPLQVLLPLTRVEIADYLGLTIETVSRQLTKLRQTGVISLTENRLVAIHDERALLGLADMLPFGQDMH